MAGSATAPAETKPAETKPAAAVPAAPADWRASLPEEIRGEKSLEKFQSFADLAKGYVSQQPLIGAEKLAIPGKDADEQTRRAFWTKLGCPEKADGYELPGELPEGVKIDEARAKAFFAEAHKVGLSRQHAAWALRMAAQDAVQQAGHAQKAKSEAVEKAMHELRSEWGQATEERLAMAREAVEYAGGSELKQALVEMGMDNDPRLVKAFAKIGRLISEDQVRGHGKASGYALSPADAERQWSAKKLDGEFMKALLDDRHPGHQAAVDEKARLHQAMYPEAPSSG